MVSKKEKNKILTYIKLLNGFSKEHQDYSYKLDKLLKTNGIEIRSSDGLSGYVDEYPDWFVDIIDYGKGSIEDITIEMLDQLLDEMNEFT